MRIDDYSNAVFICPRCQQPMSDKRIANVNFRSDVIANHWHIECARCAYYVTVSLDDKSTMCSVCDLPFCCVEDAKIESCPLRRFVHDECVHVLSKT